MKTNKSTPRPGSNAAKIINIKKENPLLDRQTIAATVGCNPRYVTATARDYRHLLDDAAPKKKHKKTVELGDGPKPRRNTKAESLLKDKILNPSLDAEHLAKSYDLQATYVREVLAKYAHLLDSPEEAKPVTKPDAKPVSSPVAGPWTKQPEIRGGNGRTDYSIKGENDGIHESGGPVKGLENFNMQVMIVDGNAAANVREAQAFVSSMRSILEGLETVEKDMENPELLGLHTLQVANIMNAANRVKDKLLYTYKKREKDHQRFVEKAKTDMPEDERTEWVDRFKEVDKKEEAQAVE